MNYITLKDMGSSGGLCSQLSIFAGLLAVARANKLKIAFSQEMIDGDEVIYPPTNELFRNSIRIFDLLDLDPNSSFATRPDQPGSPRSGNEDLEGSFFLLEPI